MPALLHNKFVSNTTCSTLDHLYILFYADSDEEVVEDGSDDGGDTTWAIPTTRGEGHRGNKVEKT